MKLKRLLGRKLSAHQLMYTVIAIYMCFAAFAWLCSDRMMFVPQSASYGDSAEIIKLDVVAGVTISALHLANPEATYTVLYSHGNAEDLGDVRERLEEYRRRGFSVFSYDYEGYGTSAGKPTAKNACRDADAALRYLVEQGKIPLDRIIVHGSSIGGGPALYLAAEHGVAAVIVESTFVTAFRVMTRVPLLPFDKFRNLARIDKVNCPVLVIHGMEDRIVPFWHGQKLFERAKEPKMHCWLAGASHNRVPPGGRAATWAVIRAFAEELGKE